MPPVADRAGVRRVESVMSLDRRPARAHVLLLALLLVAGCNGRWRESYRTSSPVLRSGVEIVHLIESDSDVVPPELRVELGAGGRRFRVTSLADLRAHLRPIDSQQAALDYSELLREFDFEGVLIPGDVIRAAPEGRRRVLEFGPAEAERWGIEFQSRARNEGSDFVIDRPVIVYGSHPSPQLPYLDPVVLLVRERISSDGAYEFEVLRELESGEAASSYVHLRH